MSAVNFLYSLLRILCEHTPFVIWHGIGSCNEAHELTDLKRYFTVWFQPLGANKTGFNLILFYFNIRGKVSII